MNRSRFLAAVLALGALLGAAEVRSASNEHQLSMEEFRKQALKERVAQGLDKNRPALFAKYPTPEVKLGANLPSVPVGSETTITLTGHFLPGSLVELGCAGAQMISYTVTESRVEARVRVTAAALPGPCSLRVSSPVSLASASREAFRVVGTYQWELALANGQKARMRTSAEAGNPNITGSCEWFGKDSKSQGKRPVTLERTPDGYRVHVERTAEEAAATERGSITPKQAAGGDPEKQMQDIQDKMQNECMKLAPDKMGGCVQKYTGQIQAISERMQNGAMAAEQKAMSGTVGCDLMTLQTAEGKVSGKGKNCGAPGEVDVTGTLSATK